MIETIEGILAWVGIGATLAAGVVVTLVVIGRRAGRREPEVRAVAIADRVRAVGRLVGLEVRAKEIATSRSGCAWLPPLLLSQARLAMIFHFERQYYVDLARLGPEDVETSRPGLVTLRLALTAGEVRLTDVTPYDIQDGRVFGLLDVIPMNAERQKDLMSRAQQQAGVLFEASDVRYRQEARRSIERHLTALLELVGVSGEIEWQEEGGGVRETTAA